MKPIKVLISEHSVAADVVSSLNKRIPAESKLSPDFMTVYPLVIETVEQFVSKAHQLAHAGTSIHIEKEYLLGGCPINLTLQSPQPRGFFESIKRLIKRS